MSAFGRKMLDGVVSGALGGGAMSISTNAEMRLRGRPPSRVPAQTVERLVGIDLGERAEQLLTTVGHVVTSAALGLARGGLDAGLVGRRAGASAFAVLAYLPDFVVLPALGSAPPPWRWSVPDLATSALHHGVYASTTNLAYARLSRRTRSAAHGG
jgi:hypothetical protein